MAHFYSASKDSPKFLPDVQTPPQARKAGSAWPSVTTVLGIVKDDFLDNIYQPKEMVRLAREHTSADWKRIKDMVYGFREHPFTGRMIPSSEFGTAVHKRIEEWLVDGFVTAGPFDDWAKPFVDWVEEEGVQVVGCEEIISDARLKIAGSVDFIGMDTSDKLFLADYKCRSCTDKGKFYGKDCKQLAVESFMLKRKLKLNYNPGIISVCIDTNSANHYHKVWTDSEYEYYLECAKLSAKTYWQERMHKPKKK